MTILCGVYFVISLFFWKVNFLEPQILPENNILVYILKEKYIKTFIRNENKYSTFCYYKDNIYF